MAQVLVPNFVRDVAVVKTVPVTVTFFMMGQFLAGLGVVGTVEVGIFGR